MQYKVPQNVDIEDRVVGPLTLRQFIIILVTVGIIIVLYFMTPSIFRFFFGLIAIFIGCLGGAIAFVKYGDQNLETFLLSAWKTFSSPRARIWKKIPEPPQTMSRANPDPKESPKKKKESLAEAQDDLKRLAELVDSGGHVSVSPKDRVIGTINQNKIETGELIDPLIRGEGPAAGLEKTIATAAKVAPDREPLISEVATVNTGKAFSYPKINTKDEPRL